jgi:hypothetical protein
VRVRVLVRALQVRVRVAHASYVRVCVRVYVCVCVFVCVHSCSFVCTCRCCWCMPGVLVCWCVLLLSALIHALARVCFCAVCFCAVRASVRAHALLIRVQVSMLLVRGLAACALVC